MLLSTSLLSKETRAELHHQAPKCNVAVHKEKKHLTSTSGFSHVNLSSSYELVQRNSKSSCTFALQQLQRRTWHGVEPGSVRTVQERGQCTHTVNCTLFSPMPCFPLHTSEEQLFINICRMTGPDPMLMRWIPMRLVLTLRLQGSSLLLLPPGRIYNLTTPFCGCKVKVTNHSFIWRPH